MHTESKRLYRSVTNRMIGGVCGGLGEYFSVDPVLVRLLFVAGAIVTGILPGGLIYLIACIIVPTVPTGTYTTSSEK
jgi:phage shock protein C